MKGHLFWIVVWVGVVFAGYLLTERLIAPPPVVRLVTQGQPEIAVPVSRNGHYYLDGSVNGVPVRFMVDTGASYVSVGAEFAHKAGFGDGIPGYFSTANGTVRHATSANAQRRPWLKPSPQLTQRSIGADFLAPLVEQLYRRSVFGPG